MIHAYDKSYLSAAQKNLGGMLDCLVNGLGHPLEEAWQWFLTGRLSARFQRVDCTVLAGMSGAELACEVLSQAGEGRPESLPPTPWDRSPEYWTGWSLAYYQWERGLSFGEIQRLVPITAVRAMYVPYHEMDVRQFADRMDQLCLAAQGESKLKRLRLVAGMSQSELAKQSGVPVRTIQQYEQGQKEIDHARGETLLRLARALACSIEDILENRPASPEEVS